MNDSFDPDSNFFNTHGFINNTYFTPETSKAMIKEIMTSHSQIFILI